MSIFLLAGSALSENMIVEDIMGALERKYSGKSFQADFEQVSHLDALDITDKASGKVYFSHPGKMKWQYLEPQQHEIITDGKSLWIYRPEEKQVIKGDAEGFFRSGTGGAFLSDISLVRKNFDIRLREVNQEYAEIDLTAKRPDKDLSSIVIRISQKNSEIVRVVTHNPYNDSTRFDFKHIKFLDLNPDIFNFKEPDNIDIIDNNLK